MAGMPISRQPKGSSKGGQFKAADAPDAPPDDGLALPSVQWSEASAQLPDSSWLPMLAARREQLTAAAGREIQFAGVDGCGGLNRTDGLPDGAAVMAIDDTVLCWWEPPGPSVAEAKAAGEAVNSRIVPTPGHVRGCLSIPTDEAALLASQAGGPRCRPIYTE